MCSNYTQTSYYTADCDVDKHALLAIPRPHPQSKEQGRENNHTRKRKKAWRNNEVLHLLYVSDSRMRRRIQWYHDRPNNANKAGDLTDNAESFLEKKSRENCADDDRKSAHRRDNNCISKCVCHEITDFANDHQSHTRPPKCILQISITFSGFFMILFICIQQTSFLQHERRADEQAGRYSEHNANYLVPGGRPLVSGVVGADGEALIDSSAL